MLRSRTALTLVLLLTAAGALAQSALVYENAGEIQAALAEAQREGAAARLRAEKLEAEAAKAVEAADKTAREAASVAARIQQGEHCSVSCVQPAGCAVQVCDGITRRQL